MNSTITQPEIKDVLDAIERHGLDHSTVQTFIRQKLSTLLKQHLETLQLLYQHNAVAKDAVDKMKTIILWDDIQND